MSGDLSNNMSNQINQGLRVLEERKVTYLAQTPSEWSYFDGKVLYDGCLFHLKRKVSVFSVAPNYKHQRETADR